MAITDVTGVKALAEGGAKLTLKLANIGSKAVRSTAVDEGALKVAEAVGDDVLRFAHGTSPESAESVLKGLNADAAVANTTGGTALAPGSFFAHPIGPPDAPGEGLHKSRGKRGKCGSHSDSGRSELTISDLILRFRTPPCRPVQKLDAAKIKPYSDGRS